MTLKNLHYKQICKIANEFWKNAHYYLKQYLFYIKQTHSLNIQPVKFKLSPPLDFLKLKNVHLKAK